MSALPPPPPPPPPGLHSLEPPAPPTPLRNSTFDSIGPPSTQRDSFMPGPPSMDRDSFMDKSGPAPPLPTAVPPPPPPTNVAPPPPPTNAAPPPPPPSAAITSLKKINISKTPPPPGLARKKIQNTSASTLKKHKNPPPPPPGMKKKQGNPPPGMKMPVKSPPAPPKNISAVKIVPPPPKPPSPPTIINSNSNPPRMTPSVPRDVPRATPPMPPAPPSQVDNSQMNPPGPPPPKPNNAGDFLAELKKKTLTKNATPPMPPAPPSQVDNSQMNPPGPPPPKPNNAGDFLAELKKKTLTKNNSLKNEARLDAKVPKLDVNKRLQEIESDTNFSKSNIGLPSMNNSNSSNDSVTIETLKKRIDELEKENKAKDMDLRKVKKSNELLMKEKKVLTDDLEDEKMKVAEKSKEIDELKNAAAEVKTHGTDDDDEDDDWDTGNDDQDNVKEMQKKITKYEKELKELKNRNNDTNKAIVLTESPSDDKNRNNVESLRLLLDRERKEKEKALKLVIDLVGKKRFTNILDSGKDLKAVKTIIRRKINQSASSSSNNNNTSLEAKFKPHVGQGAWWSTRYMDEVQTETAVRTKRSPRSPSSPKKNNYVDLGLKATSRRNLSDGNNKTATLADYSKWMRIAERQKMNAHAMKAPFVGGGRRQTYFSNLRDGHNDKMNRINSAGKDAILKAAQAYKQANNW